MLEIQEQISEFPSEPLHGDRRGGQGRDDPRGSR